MIESAAADPSASNPGASRLSLWRVIPGWLLSAMLALIFVLAGGMKLMSQPNMVREFVQVGLGQWFRYFTGILEVAGAIAILIPPASRWGAVALASVMSGAIVAHFTVLHSPPFLPAVLLVLVFAAAWLRRL